MNSILYLTDFLVIEKKNVDEGGKMKKIQIILIKL